MIGKPPTRKSPSPQPLRGVPPTAADIARQPLESFDAPWQPDVQPPFQEQAVYTDVAASRPLTSASRPLTSVLRPLEGSLRECQPPLQPPLCEAETAIARVTDGEGKKTLEESHGEAHSATDLSTDSSWEMMEEDAIARTSIGVKDALARTLRRAKRTEDKLIEMTSERDALRRTLESEGDVLRRAAQNEGNRLERELAEVELERDALRGKSTDACPGISTG